MAADSQIVSPVPDQRVKADAAIEVGALVVAQNVHLRSGQFEAIVARTAAQLKPGISPNSEPAPGIANLDDIVSIATVDVAQPARAALDVADRYEVVPRSALDLDRSDILALAQPRLDDVIAVAAEYRNVARRVGLAACENKPVVARAAVQYRSRSIVQPEQPSA